jgi:DNA-binding MarR family transcriptional regulator
LVSNHVSHAFKVKVERHGVTVAEWVVSRALFDEDGVKPSQLADKLAMTRSSISKLLDRLAAKGFVEVEGDELDGRAQVVHLTARGRRLVPKLAASADENDAETFGDLGAEERATLLATLKRVVAHLGLRGPPVD